MWHVQNRTPFHCLVWIDHRIARVFSVAHHEMTERAVIHAPEPHHGHVHHHAGTMGPGHEPVSPQFLKDVTAALEDPAEILIAGPAQAKHALKDYIADKAPALAERIAGVETLDKIGDGELHDFAHRFFHRADLMGFGAAKEE